jgi:gluconolactonase
MKILAEGLQFPEGPVALGDGSVVLVEMRAGRIVRVAPDGQMRTVSDCGGGPNGAAIGPDGALYVCDNGGSAYVPGRFTSTGPAPGYEGGSIRRVDLAGGSITTLYTHCGEHRLSSPNDLVFDAHGGFYFTDFGKKHARARDSGGVYYALPDGSRIVEVAYGLLSPNGIGLSPDNRVLYVAETETARLWAFDIVAPGVADKHPVSIAARRTPGLRTAGLPALRQPGGAGERPCVHRHAGHGRDLGRRTPPANWCASRCFPTSTSPTSASAART